MTRARPVLVVLTAVLLAISGVAASAPTASADGSDSSSTQTATYTGNGQSCSVYGNGSGMGSYCLNGGGVAETLRQRFGNQIAQKCRYRPLPDGVEAPAERPASEGQYMMMLCLNNIDFDTYSGGTDKVLGISVVWVPADRDISDDNNEISTFLWKQFQKGAQLPVPFLQTKPNVTPIVGVPTYFTFQWRDPATRDVVADPEGPYKDRKDTGGPFLQIKSDGGLIMQAQATSISIDPQQKDMKKITCDADAPYVPGAPPSKQPKGACMINFARSSATARQYATYPIPTRVGFAYYPRIVVNWTIRYGTPGDMRELGNGFEMRVKQVVPVQEVQAPNQPPSVLYD